MSRGRALALVLAGLLAVAAAPAGAAARGSGLRRYVGHGLWFDHPAGWHVREEVDDDHVVLRVSRRAVSPGYVRIGFARHLAGQNGAVRLADVVEAFRRREQLKAGPLKFAEKPVIRKLLGGPTPGRKLRYVRAGRTHTAEIYVARRGRRTFSLTFVAPSAEGRDAAAAREAREVSAGHAAVADSFHADETLPARYPPVAPADRRAYVGHGVAFQYPAGWLVREAQDEGSVTITVDEGPGTSPYIRLVLLRAETAPRLHDVVTTYRAEVQARSGPARFEARKTARALNGERADGASVSYSLRGAAQLTEVFLVQAGRRTGVVLLHAATAERSLAAPAFDLFARTLLVGPWPRSR